jgi:thioredoxin-dependent peroxiredoxin
MSRHPAVGERAPDFTLEGTQGSFTLSEHRGEKVVLLFYPGDDTPVCTRQFCSYRDDAEAFGALGATAVGISGKGIESKQAFADKHGLTVPLLADRDHAVSKAYDCWSKLRGTRRSVVIVDEQGIVGHRHDHALGLDFQTAGEIQQSLAALQPSAPTRR